MIFVKKLKLQYDAKENDDFKYAKYSTYTKIYQILGMSYILVVLVILYANVCQIIELNQNL